VACNARQHFGTDLLAIVKREYIIVKSGPRQDLVRTSRPFDHPADRQQRRQ